MKYLITGGAGFIGSNFIHYLLETQTDCLVINLDALTYAGNLENLRAVDKDPRYRFEKGNICDRGLAERLVAECDIIVNFAAESHVDRSILGPEIFVETNVRGTQVLLEAARKHRKRFHHVSTDEVFGSLGPEDPPFDEKTPYDPRSPYSASKAGADHLVRAYFHTYGLSVTITNCSNNYGPYHFPEKLIPLAITNLLEEKKIPVYGDGKQIRDWLYVRDHCRAIGLVLEKGKAGETYLVGGGNQKNNLAVLKMILGLMNEEEEKLEIVKDRPGHDRRYAIDSGKIERELGWRPEVTLEDGLKMTVEWFRANEAWWRRCKSGEYQKYYQEQYPPSTS